MHLQPAIIRVCPDTWSTSNKQQATSSHPSSSYVFVASCRLPDTTLDALARASGRRCAFPSIGTEPEPQALTSASATALLSVA